MNIRHSDKGTVTKSYWLAMAGLIAAIASGPATSNGQESKAPDPSEQPQAEVIDQQQFEAMVQRGVDYLINQGQADDGSYTGFAGTGITSLVISGLLDHGVPVDHPTIVKALKYLESSIQEDGGIYQSESVHRNYETSLAIMCLGKANADGRYDKVLEKATRFLVDLQWDESESVDPSNEAHGGAGYGSHDRPDLSNTSYFMDALKSVGTEANDTAIQKALIFASRTQNHPSSHNTLEFATKNRDGGFIYTPFGGGESKAGSTANGGLRSYGSMTYAGLKSLLYAGVKPDDERVVAARKWIEKHYRLDTNPGMGAQGLFYYYHVFAKTLSVLGDDEFKDAEGKLHDWRKELAAELYRRQSPDGSWINTQSERWLEGNPNLVTAYSLLALSYCKPSFK